MNGQWDFTPSSIAALIEVRTPDAKVWSAIYMSREQGVVVGHSTPLAQSGWPQEVQDSIDMYFKHVFALEHERWKGSGP